MRLVDLRTGRRRIRVAHVITRLCKGGAQENTFHTLRLADRDRYEMDLISGPTTGHEGSIEQAVQAAGISIIREPNLVRDVAPLREMKALANLTHLFRQGRYDIVHTHTSKAGFVGRLAARRAATPLIVHTPHGNIYHGYFPMGLARVFIEMERRAARWTDRLIELTEGGIEESLQWRIGRREQYTAIFSGIDTAPYDSALEGRAEARAALGVRPDDLLVGAVGRLEPIKGFTYFVAAAKIVAEAVPEARFILAGQGSLAAALRAEAAPLGHRFQCLGPREDVPELMAAMDVLVVPSLNEGMGRVLLEAGAGATPVVGTTVGGIPEILKDSKTGILVPPKAPEAIAQAVQALAADRDRLRRMGEAARARVVPDFSLENMVMRIEALYEDLIKEKGIDP